MGERRRLNQGRRSARVGNLAGGAFLATLAVVAGSLLIGQTGGGSGTVAQAPAQPRPSPAAEADPDPDADCSTTGASFVPTAVSIPGVARKVSVVPMPRDDAGVPGVRPLSGDGKNELAFDLGSGILPGDARGNALLNAHTFADGSALGNRLLGGLHEGDRLVVHGPAGTICYQVSDRVEVPFDHRAKRYFATKGAPQIAIVVCSGERVGPGDWTKRTLWFASPMV